MSAFERSEKESHLDTIWYEIAMLGFCHAELATQREMSEPERNLYIEGFLLHFRNIVEFFSGRKHRAARNGEPADISTADPEVWAGRKLTAEELDSMQTPARALEDRYFKDISQYLQHCTERRFDQFKQWEITKMRAELAPVALAFRKAVLPPEEARPRTATRASSDATHTLSMTATNIFGILDENK